jgi:hypothetical protein
MIRDLFLPVKFSFHPSSYLSLEFFQEGSCCCQIMGQKAGVKFPDLVGSFRIIGVDVCPDLISSRCYRCSCRRVDLSVCRCRRSVVKALSVVCVPGIVIYAPLRRRTLWSPRRYWAIPGLSVTQAICLCMVCPGF